MIPGKATSAIGFRPTMIGDGIMSLVLAAYLRRRHPDCYINWVVGGKCSVAAPLYVQHPLIDRILVSSTDGYGPELADVVRCCDFVFDPLPQHPTGDGWVNDSGIDIYSETFRMSGLPLSEYAILSTEERCPRLYPWWPIKRQPKTVALWPAAHQGVKQKRYPAFEWYSELVTRLGKEGYRVLQFGHPDDFKGRSLTGSSLHDMRYASFLEQVQMSVGCDVVITTDSGAGLVQGAYRVNQISLLTNHWPGHDPAINPLCFSTNNPKNRPLFAAGDPDLIPVDDVVASVKEMT